MPIETSAALFARERLPREAFVAFNVITLEHAEGIVAGAERAGRPVILQLSENAIRFHGGPRAIARAMTAVADEARTDVVLHLDHTTDESLVRATADLGFSSVMYDAATLPFAENLDRTRAMADWCRDQGVWIEAELGEVGGKNGAHAFGVRTDPAEAALFVERTGVDALAVAVGSSHRMTGKTASLDFDLISRLAEAVPVPLVLHGSSGVADDDLTAAAERGMRKVNIGTALNIAYTAAVRDALAAHPDQVDPRPALREARERIADDVAAVLTVLDGR